MKSLKPTIYLLAATLLWAGCTTAQVNWSREMRTLIQPHDGVAIVAPRPAGADEEISFATEATSCIAAALRDAYPALKIVRADEFNRTAPDVALELAPRALIHLPLLLNDAAFRARIAPLGLRYLISVQGETSQKAKPIVGAVGGHGGAVTVLGAEWDRRSNLTASILDVEQVLGAGEIRASTQGKPWFVCVGMLFLCAPIGAPAFTESKACKELGEGVVKFLAGENEPDMAFVYGKTTASYIPITQKLILLRSTCTLLSHSNIL